ncbi:malectin domain-containing carbohydrate-binding protein [Cyclobacterium sp.]|uniref:malectin domain-containing carbohydrate-binding protein n=1 Tax=Cyclobacterium sp. TaxID=1966343 RepID=UPI00397116F6
MNRTVNKVIATQNRFIKGAIVSAFLIFFTTIVINGETIGAKNTYNDIEHRFDLQDQDTVPLNDLGEELWKAGHESGTQEEWLHSGGGGEFNSNRGDSYVSTEVARSGEHSLKMSINTTNGGGHATRNYRWAEIADHKDLIFTQYVYFPNRIDFDRNNNWFNLIQTKGVKFAPGGAGTGPDQINLPHFVLGLEVRGGAGSGGANYLSLADLQKFWGSEPDVIWKAPAGIDLPVKKWVKIQMRIIQDRGDKGRVLVWQDDTLIIDTKFRNTLRPEVDINMYSINAYADKTYPNVTNIYLDDLSINLPGSSVEEKEPVSILEPAVSIIVPQNEFRIVKGEPLTIETEVSADPSLDVDLVEFFINGEWVGDIKNSPYNFNLTGLSEGEYQLKAKVWDSRRVFSESKEVSFMVLPKEEENAKQSEPIPDETAELPSNSVLNYSFGSNQSVVYDEMVYFPDPVAEFILGTSYKYSNAEASNIKLFQQERNSPDLRLKIPVKNGNYSVVTYHNELWFGRKGPAAKSGQRVFTIQMEGNSVQKDLDLFRENNNKPIRLTFNDIEVVDGFLDIRMIASVNRATISGLSIIPEELNEKPLPAENEFQMALNVGGRESAIYEDYEFEAEIGAFDFFNSPTTYSDDASSKDVLFQTERHGLNLTYKIPVPNGKYLVKTYHNELWFGKKGPAATAGNRVFSISLEGKVVKNDLDLFLQSNNQPLELIFEEVEVLDGVLELELEASSNRATLSGLSITGFALSSGSNLRIQQTSSDLQDFEEDKKNISAASVSLYPNPAVDQIYLEGNGQEFQQFIIHDSFGNFLYEFDPKELKSGNNRYLLSLSGIKEGIYLISIIQKDNTVERLRFLIGS